MSTFALLIEFPQSLPCLYMWVISSFVASLLYISALVTLFHVGMNTNLGLHCTNLGEW